MTSSRKITVEADLGKKGVEKTDVYVYENTKMIETHFDKSFEDIRKIAEELKIESDVLAPFCDELIRLAEDFDFDGIQTLCSS